MLGQPADLDAAATIRLREVGLLMGDGRAVRAWTAVLRQVARRRSVILGYHGVADATLAEDPYRLQVPVERFRAQMELLVAAGFRFLTMTEMARQVAAGPPPRGLAAVSFDDGLRNNLTAALPILTSLQIPATVYVPSGWLDGQHPDIGPGGDNAILGEDELGALVQAGWEVGAHTVNHADLSLLDYGRCRSEIARNREQLEGLTGSPVKSLAYPFGRYGSAAIAAARDCGLLSAVTTDPTGWRAYEFGRIMVGGGDSLRAFGLRLMGRYETVVDGAPLRALRAGRQRTRRWLGR